MVDNALKYSTGNIYFSIQESEGICCIIVENFAREIGERELNDIFELFYTEDKARNSNGMGLYITKKLVKQLGGEISASYEGGKFRIHIELQAELQATTI